MKRLSLFLLSCIIAVLTVGAQTTQNEEQPLLTIGCVSDVHCMNSMITPASGNLEDIRVRSSLTRVLERMKAEDLPDVLIFGGDSESDKSIDEVNSKMTRWVLADAMRQVFQEGQNPNVLWLTGNHDYEVANFDNIPKPYNAGNFYDFPMREDIGILSEDDLFYEMADNGVLGQEKLLAAYHYVINGFDFVVLNCGKYFFRYAWDYTFSVESCTWVKNKLEEIYKDDPDKTVFFLCHVPFEDSNSINAGKGMKTTEGYPILKAALAAHPNLIMLYGHDHGKDSAYIREKTSQRVTLYDTNGNRIDTTDATHVDGEVGGGTTANAAGVSHTARAASTPQIISNANIKSKSGKYFGLYSATDDVNVLDEPFAFELRPVSGYDNAYGFWVNSATKGVVPINSGTSGYLSRGSTPDNERLFYFYEATEKDGIITAHLVNAPKPDTDYLIGVANTNPSPNNGFYLVYCSLASGKNNRFDVININHSAATGRTVAEIPETLTIDNTYSSSNGPISLDKVLWQIVFNNPVPTPDPEPEAKPSFFSSFMGSLRYYYNSINTGDPADMPDVVQALIVKVYNDRVVLQMKNYNKTGVLAGKTIVEVPANYTSFRTVTHSEPVTYEKGEATEKPEISGITDAVMPEHTAAMYDLQGRRVLQPQNGIIIEEGKKRIAH